MMYLPDDATESELCEMATETRENSRIPHAQPWHAADLTVDEKIALVDDNPYLTKRVKSALTWDLITDDINGRLQP